VLHPYSEILRRTFFETGQKFSRISQTRFILSDRHLMWKIYIMEISMQELNRPFLRKFPSFVENDFDTLGPLLNEFHSAYSEPKPDPYDP
jgi:hypothetical protein